MACTWHECQCAWHVICLKPKGVLSYIYLECVNTLTSNDAGGPSSEPPAKRRIVPIDHAVPKTVIEAKQKLAFIEQETMEAITAINAEVGVG